MKRTVVPRSVASTDIQPRASPTAPCGVWTGSIVAKPAAWTFASVSSGSSRARIASRSLSPTRMPAALGSATSPLTVAATRR